jgi:hypothetical protein
VATLIIDNSPSLAVEEEAPPIGLSEDEAYDPSYWVKTYFALCMVLLGGMAALQTALGVMLLVGDEATVEAWGSWGSSSALGGVLLVSAALLASGLLMVLRRDDDGLALLMLGFCSFAVAMVCGIFRYEGGEGPSTLLVLLLVPLVGLFGLQSNEVRRWWFHSTPGPD